VLPIEKVEEILVESVVGLPQFFLM